MVQNKKVIFSFLETARPHQGSVKLCHPRYLCFVSRTPLPRTPKGPCCKWHVKIDCWVSAWLTGLCGQCCALPSTALLWCPWGSMVGARHCRAHTSSLQQGLELQACRKGALHPPHATSMLLFEEGKSDGLSQDKIRCGESYSLHYSALLDNASCFVFEFLNNTSLEDQRAVHQDPSLLSVFLAHPSKQTHFSQPSMTIQNHASTWKCECQLWGLALLH